MERNHYAGRNLWGETFWMERNPFNGEKPFDWRETFRLERNLSIGPSWSFCVIGIMESAEESWTQTAFITSKWSNFIISTKVKMKMQLRLTKFTFHLVESNFIISTKVKMKMALLQEGHCCQWSLHKPSEINTCYKSLYDTVHVTRTV